MRFENCKNCAAYGKNTDYGVSVCVTAVIRDTDGVVCWRPIGSLLVWKEEEI